jgi:hypothetical protein
VLTVTLFLAGFNKCGSTTLSALLGRHPQILMPAETEPWYFIKTPEQMTWQEFSGQFPRWREFPMVCDDSAGGYASRPPGRPGLDQAVERIHEHNPDAKLLFIARDPVVRLESAFRELHDTGPRYGVLPPFDLEEAIDQLPQLLLDSCYHECLTRYRERFDPAQIHLVYLEDLVTAPTPTMAAVWRFLGLDGGAVAVEPLPRENAGAVKLRDSRTLRRMRSARIVGPRLARQSIDTQDRWMAKAGLRRRFGTQVRWTECATAAVAERLVPDMHRLWQEYSPPARGWARAAELAAGRARDTTR